MPLTANSPLRIIRDYFGMTDDQFSAEWKGLDISNKKNLLTGLRNGSLTY